MKPIDYKILSHLRKNAIKPIPRIAKETGVPPSTIYEKIKRQYTEIIKKHITLLDFHALNFHTIVHFAISCNDGEKLEIKNYLLAHPRINSLHRINFGWDYLAEGVFRNFAEAEDFKTLIKKRFSPRMLECFNVVEELKKEEFLSQPEHFLE